MRIFFSITVIAAVFFALKIPSLNFAEIETDELIYISVATNLKLNDRYSLQGTKVLERLSAEAYDHPFFHHPPLAIRLMEKTLAPGRGPRSAVVVSWLGHALILAGLMLWLHVLLPGSVARLAPWVLLLAAMDPLAVHSGQRIWLDALVSGWVALGTGLYVTALTVESRRRQTWLLLACGLALGLGVLTKLPAVLAFPVLGLAFILRCRDRSPASALRHLACVGLPAAIVVTPWLVEFYGHYGTLFPGWIRPNEWMMEHHPFVRRMRERPPYYFFQQMLLVYPWLALTGWMAFKAIKRRDSSFVLPAVFVLWIVVAITALAVFAGHGFQMRYLGLLIAPLYALFALTLRDLLESRRRALPFFVAGAALAAGCAVAHVIHHTWFDVRSWIQILS